MYVWWAGSGVAVCVCACVWWAGSGVAVCVCVCVCVCVWWTGSGVAMGHGQGGGNPCKAVPAAPGSGLIPALLQPVIPGVLLSLVVEYF